MLAFLWHARWVVDPGFGRTKFDQPVGWYPHMMIFSLMGIGVLVWCFWKLPVGTLLPLLSVLDAFVAWHFLRRSLPRIGRLGWTGALRARWWIEAAAVSWTLACCGGLFCLAHSFPNANLPPWQAACLWGARWGGLGAFISFVVFAITGYGLGLIKGRSVRGRSAELVNYFFWTIVLIGGGARLVPDNPILSDVIAPAVLGLGIGAAVIAAIIAAGQHFRFGSAKKEGSDVLTPHEE